MIKIKEIYRSVLNIIKFWKVIWKWRWWDYSFQVNLIVHQLKELEKVWGNKTHYIGDRFTLGRIKVVLKYYEEYSTTIDIVEEDKKLKKFLKAYVRLLPRLWD